MTDPALDPLPLPSRGRWADYVLGRDDQRYGYGFDEIVRAGTRGDAPSVYVMGIGYDPRVTVAFEAAAPLLPAGSTVLGIEPRASRGTSREKTFQLANASRVEEIAKAAGLDLKRVEPNPGAHDRRFHGNWLTRHLMSTSEWSRGCPEFRGTSVAAQ